MPGLRSTPLARPIGVPARKVKLSLLQATSVCFFKLQLHSLVPSCVPRLHSTASQLDTGKQARLSFEARARVFDITPDEQMKESVEPIGDVKKARPPPRLSGRRLFFVLFLAAASPQSEACLS